VRATDSRTHIYRKTTLGMLSNQPFLVRAYILFGAIYFGLILLLKGMTI